ncbi:MAG: Xaa-Pro peptidase family protein [Brockia lithotrophica]|nr:Xaa-Pro peptidase family protein [Brockia lithotrophica]
MDGANPVFPKFPNDPRKDEARAPAERRRRLAAFLRDEGIAFALVTRPLHIAYLTGMFLEPHERFVGLLLFPEGESLLVVPAVEDVAGDLPVLRYRDGEDPYRAVGAHVRKVLARGDLPGGTGREIRIGVEEEHLTLARAARLAAGLAREGLAPHRLCSVDGALHEMRAVKGPEELAALARAARDTDALLAAWIRELRPGMSEREAVRILERLRDEAGFGPFAFDPIVLTGERTALPHGVPGDAPLRPWSLLLVDVGVTCCGYAGDLTRTYVLVGAGPAPREERQTWERLYRAVEEAQTAALAAVAVGRPYAEVDRAARGVLERYGLAEYFVHRTGHGLGLEIHEAPQVAPDSQERATPGHVFTVEPGVYIPGVGGVRIEDVVALAEAGVEVLTRSPKAWDSVLLSLPPSMA